MGPTPTKPGFVRADEAQCPNRKATVGKSHTVKSIVVLREGGGAPEKFINQAEDNIIIRIGV